MDGALDRYGPGARILLAERPDFDAVRPRPRNLRIRLPVPGR